MWTMASLPGMSASVDRRGRVESVGQALSETTEHASRDPRCPIRDHQRDVEQQRCDSDQPDEESDTERSAVARPGSARSPTRGVGQHRPRHEAQPRDPPLVPHVEARCFEQPPQLTLRDGAHRATGERCRPLDRVVGETGDRCDRGDDDAASRANEAGEFGGCGRLVGVPVERLGARDDVDRAVGDRQALGVGADECRWVARPTPARRPVRACRRTGRPRAPWRRETRHPIAR